MKNLLTFIRAYITQILLGLGLLISVIVFFSFIASLTYIDQYEMGYSFDKFSGKVEKLDRTGYFLKPWWQYELNTIDLRPYQVSISANQRVLNAKLVKFNPEGFETFLEWHGRGAGEDVATLKDILMSYAFNVNRGADCPFLIVSEELDQKSNLVSVEPADKK